MENKTYEIVDSVEKLEDAIKRVRKAQQIFAGYTQEQVDKIFLAAASAATRQESPSQRWLLRKQAWALLKIRS